MSRSVKTATQFKVIKMSQFKLGSFSRLALLASSALMAGHFSTVSVLAQTKTETTEGSDLRGKMSDDSSLRHLTIGENTEKVIAADAGNIPFMISVDGDTVETSASKPTA